MAGCVQFVTANTCASERSVVMWTDTSLLCTTYSHGAIESSSSGERALVWCSRSVTSSANSPIVWLLVSCMNGGKARSDLPFSSNVK